ncbi:hypothetical protein [Cognatazoarcus halotolerans]|uniref:hypothetical protein n=1 Tax=Cognatazoarcus halotolerans TaxID=2686016 RepID=UPI001358C495|nr:hypothetical protein [Cognatazoarcus halotolerans]MCB1899430.1 hypothetical protein [Rhodocyclaceae bacterium]MCP5310120.1 hypothetical protein [Zoogloeaceae bacterium]
MRQDMSPYARFGGALFAMLITATAFAEAPPPERKYLKCSLNSVTIDNGDGEPVQTQPHSETVHVAFYDRFDAVLLRRGQSWYVPAEIDPCDMTVSPAEIRLGCYPEGGIRDGVRFRISRVSGEVLWERIGGMNPGGSVRPYYRFTGICDPLPSDPLVPPKTRF